jgi:hypothetical protein
MSQVEKNISIEDAKEQVKKACRRLGLLHLSFAKTILEELGEDKGKKLILKAIKEYGTAVGEEAKSKASARGLNNNPANFIDDLPAYGMHERAEVVKVQGERRTRAFGCVMAGVWNSHHGNKAGCLYCYVDLAKMMAFNPDYKMVHLKAVPLGDDYCEFAIRPTSKQERLDFTEKNKDWRYMDEYMNR